MFGLYTVKDCGGHNFERLAVSLYGSYRKSKTIFRILRHHSFTGQRPKLIQENHVNKPHPNIHAPIKSFKLSDCLITMKIE